jgi:tRNA threonylcarbamoyladenosine biosynthesis protein TsaB
VRPDPASRRLLALDTTGEYGSIALIEGDSILEEVPLQSLDGFAHIIFGEIQRLLDRHSLRLADLHGFASASGPGSFTGVRVGLTAVKGLAEATQRQVVAVSNLEALAWFGTRSLRAPMIDARRGEIYGAVYDASLKPVCNEVVMPLPRWLETLPNGDLEIVTMGFPLAEVKYSVVNTRRPLAAAIAHIASRRFDEGLARDPAEIDANYVRRSDAELLWKEAR